MAEISYTVYQDIFSGEWCIRTEKRIVYRSLYLEAVIWEAGRLCERYERKAVLIMLDDGVQLSMRFSDMDNV